MPLAPRNEIIAKLDAEAHLSDLLLPADVVDYHRWWVVPGESPSSVLQYVRDHPPAGGRFVLAASFELRGQPALNGTEFKWPAEPRRLGTRWLLVEAVQLPGGSTGVRADSQVVWITVRPASERIPAGSRRLVLTTTRFGRLIQGPITVRSPGAIRRVVTLLNALPALQAGVTACPADWGSRIRLALYGPVRARPLAMAVV